MRAPRIHDLDAAELAELELQRNAGELQVAPWRGGLAWAAEVRRLAIIMRCRRSHHSRFERTCRQLTLERLRSPLECDRDSIDAILPLLEGARRAGGIDLGPYGPHRTGWKRAELGELLVEARNLARLHAIGRDRPKAKGPRFDLARMPLAALERLIQRHRNLNLVELLRAERNRRHTGGNEA